METNESLLDLNPSAAATIEDWGWIETREIHTGVTTKVLVMKKGHHAVLPSNSMMILKVESGSGITFTRTSSGLYAKDYITQGSLVMSSAIPSEISIIAKSDMMIHMSLYDCKVGEVFTHE